VAREIGGDPVGVQLPLSRFISPSPSNGRGLGQASFAACGGDPAQGDDTSQCVTVWPRPRGGGNLLPLGAKRLEAEKAAACCLLVGKGNGSKVAEMAPASGQSLPQSTHTRRVG